MLLKGSAAEGDSCCLSGTAPTPLASSNRTSVLLRNIPSSALIPRVRARQASPCISPLTPSKPAPVIGLQVGRWLSGPMRLKTGLCRDHWERGFLLSRFLKQDGGRGDCKPGTGGGHLAPRRNKLAWKWNHHKGWQSLESMWNRSLHILGAPAPSHAGSWLNLLDLNSVVTWNNKLSCVWR